MSKRILESNITLGSDAVTDRSVLRKEWNLIKNLNADKSIKKTVPFLGGIVHHAMGYESLSPPSKIAKYSVKKNYKSQKMKTGINRTNSLMSLRSQETIGYVVEHNGMDESSKASTSYEISADTTNESQETIGYVVENNGMDESPKVSSSYEISTDTTNESQETIGYVVENNGMDESPKVSTSYETSADTTNESQETIGYVVENNGMDESPKVSTSYEISADTTNESQETITCVVENNGLDESSKMNTSYVISPDGVDELQYISDSILNNCTIVDENCGESQECSTTCKNDTGAFLNEPRTVVTEKENGNTIDKNVDDNENLQPFVSRRYSVDENTVDGNISTELSTPKCELVRRLCKTDTNKKNCGSLSVRRSARIQSKRNKNVFSIV